MNVVADLAKGFGVGTADNPTFVTDPREFQRPHETYRAVPNAIGGSCDLAISISVRKLSSISRPDLRLLDLVDHFNVPSFTRGCTGSFETEADNV